MITGRIDFGVGHINNFIYAVAGINVRGVEITSCERYDIIRDKWEEMP